MNFWKNAFYNKIESPLMQFLISTDLPGDEILDSLVKNTCWKHK